MDGYGIAAKYPPALVLDLLQELPIIETVVELFKCLTWKSNCSIEQLCLSDRLPILDEYYPTELFIFGLLAE